MKKLSLLALFISIFVFPSVSFAKELPKIAVWDLVSREVKPTYAQELTSILASEIAKLKKYEVYTQENVRTLAGWTEERMKLGCTSTQCLTALGQMDIAKLISGSVGKIGSRYSISLNLFDTQNARAENMISEFCRSEDELIDLVQVAIRKLLGEEVVPSKVEEKKPEKETTAAALPELGKPFKDPFAAMEFVFIKGGCFEMGDTFGDGENDEKPVHEVCVDDFYLGKYEVTQGQWEKVMENNPSNFKGRDNPVERVSWNDVQQFIERLNNQSGRKHRLPTEAEWEYAARSGGKREKWSGTSQEADLGQYAWYSNNSGGQTHPVGEKRPNGLGLYDLSGNVEEWCADWYDGNYYTNSPKDNPSGPGNGQYRVLRGGSWGLSPGLARAAYRFRIVPAFRGSLGGLGFRLRLSAR
jgi:formylglycine-generating enzyme required for sulfatase activity